MYFAPIQYIDWLCIMLPSFVCVLIKVLDCVSIGHMTNMGYTNQIKMSTWGLDMDTH